MFELAVSVPAVFSDSSLREGIDRVAAHDVRGIEFFDWESADLEAVVGQCDAYDLDVAAVLSAGAGSAIEEPVDGHALTIGQSRERAVDDIERSLRAATRINCPNLIVTVGPDQEDVDRHEQRENIVSVLEAVAPTADSHGITVVVEPLNTAVDHPGYFLTSSREGYEIVDAVDSPNVKLLFDVYHQQITEGNVIRNLTDHLDYVGHVHVADVPGRGEPGTGELNYENVLGALADAGYDGYVGAEFMPDGDPDDALGEFISLAEGLE